MSERIWDRAEPPWFLSSNRDSSRFTDFMWKLRQELGPTALVVQLRGCKMETEVGLFDEISASLQFPYYFGENWDALDECLADLSWFEFKSVVVCILGAERVLRSEAEQLPKFVALLCRTAQYWTTPVSKGDSWDRPSIPFHIVIHTSTDEQIGSPRWGLPTGAVLELEDE